MKFKLTPFWVLCLTGGVAIFSSTMAKNPALPLYVKSLGISDTALGFIAASSTIVGILASLPAGAISDAIGRRRVVLFAAVIFATAPFLYLFVHNAGMLVLVRIYHGLATAILGPVALAIVADTFDKGRGERMGWYSSATLVGRFLAPFAGGLLIFGNDFHLVYLADGVAGIITLLLAIRLPKEQKITAGVGDILGKNWRKYTKEISFVFRHKGILATSGAEAAQYFGYGCLETFLPVYLSEKLGFAAWQIGLLFTAQIVVTAFTKPIMGRLSDRYGRTRTIIAGLVLGGAIIILILSASNYLLLLTLIALSGLGLAIVTSSTSALVADLAREEGRGSALGVMSGIMDIGQSSGPILTGILIGTFSFAVAFTTAGLVLITMSLVFWAVMRVSKPRTQDTAV
ncbi:putative arabinose efflux permease, MFS family [Dehalogenimonas formicexedens]|uniref:Putative arabinose efflux permease, MFS family n=1 Tax=Dehalogenimonas formicexedens TaxID=1839801 RepID=A0A1P8F4L6_9CHLR|nr:MFS transporter [Dehalogenimonas formicexedens]APV43395.1 putative arabinose efflux permease, MFS family [Dehalogenimonas formicexedens]